MRGQLRSHAGLLKINSKAYPSRMLNFLLDKFDTGSARNGRTVVYEEFMDNANGFALLFSGFTLQLVSYILPYILSLLV